MHKIQAKGYQVIINKGIYTRLNEYLLSQDISSIIILSDENTEKHCLPILLRSLDDTIRHHSVIIIPGEERKNLETCVFLWDSLARQGIDRRSLLINIGGGVVTDMGGFIASTFKR